jgi:hypothetical protein
MRELAISDLVSGCCFDLVVIFGDGLRRHLRPPSVTRYMYVPYVAQFVILVYRGRERALRRLEIFDTGPRAESGDKLRREQTGGYKIRYESSIQGAAQNAP